MRTASAEIPISWTLGILANGRLHALSQPAPRRERSGHGLRIGHEGAARRIAL